MGFANFGVVSFTDQAKVADFVTYLEQGKVMATRCKKCGHEYFPPRADCPDCIGSEVEWFAIEDAGKLATYTTVNYGPSGFENDAPYTLAIVDFPSGLRVFHLPRVKSGHSTGALFAAMDFSLRATTALIAAPSYTSESMGRPSLRHWIRR